MKKKIFYNNLAFRLAAPLLFGIVIYLLILMFFDSVEMLASNFFSREVLFIVGLTFVFFEINRLVIIAMNTLVKESAAFYTRLSLQCLASFILTAAAVSLMLHLYFLNIEGFSTITTELITFNLIYLFAAVFYNLYYFSIYYLNKRNDELILSEKKSRDTLELELITYKSQINPELLFRALEIIIEELHHSKKQADDLIESLATVYRYTLDNQNIELVEISRELGSLDPLMSIFRAKYPDSVFIKNEITGSHAYFLVPGTLLALFEHAVINNLISKELPLNFKIRGSDGHLLVSYELNERITETKEDSFRIDNLAKTYKHLSYNDFISYFEGRTRYFRVPLLEVEDE